MRALLKGGVEHALVASGIAALARRSKRGDTLVIAYHDVVPHGEDLRGDASLHLAQRRFASQLDTIGHLGDVVSLADIDREPRSDRPRFVVTFDDAYEGALTAGTYELRKRGMPATVFVAPGILGLTPWWDLIAHAKTGVIEEHARTHALTVLAGRRDAVLEWAGVTAADASASRRPVLGSREQLRDSLRYDGLAIGSHTWSHPNLTVLDGQELERELRSPAEWLANAFPDRYVPWLAYPYGQFSPAVERAAKAAGYIAALRVDGGWVGPWDASNTFAIPRLNVPSGVSRAGFTLRVSGIGVSRSNALPRHRVP